MRTSSPAAASAHCTEEIAQIIAAGTELEQTFSRLLEEHENVLHAPIAIIGMACRLPGGIETPADWDAAREEGRSLIVPVPDRSWSPDTLALDPASIGPLKQGGFIQELESFDADLFALDRDEARHLDPQQRLLLETAWRALEDAAIAPDSVRGQRIGVYVGLCGQDWSIRLARSPLTQRTRHFVTGTSHAVAAGRLAYQFGLTGPALAVDTACASSLTALHLATRALRQGEVDAALVIAANCILEPDVHRSHDLSGLISADGRCQPFAPATGQRAGGFGRSEAGAALLLKRLDVAQREHDRIHAVIRGSSLGQDGPRPALTEPQGSAQREVMRRALADAQVDAADVGYVEAHATGTPMGDAVEWDAIADVYGTAQRQGDQPLWVGSHKPCVSHTEATAGLLGVIHIAGLMQRDRIPAHPNPVDTDFRNQRVAVTDQDVPWPRDRNGTPAHAAVNAFGYGGTNAHVILAAPPIAAAPEPANQPRSPLPIRIPLAARDATELTEFHESLRRAAQGATNAALAFSAMRSLVQHQHRAVLAIAPGDPLPGSLPPGVHSIPAAAWELSLDGSTSEQLGPALHAVIPAFQSTAAILTQRLALPDASTVSGASARLLWGVLLLAWWLRIGLKPSAYRAATLEGRLIAAVQHGRLSFPAAQAWLTSQTRPAGTPLQWLPDIAILVADGVTLDERGDDPCAWERADPVFGGNPVPLAPATPEAWIDCVSALWLQGLHIQWPVIASAYREAGGTLPRLPGTRFRRERLWPDDTNDRRALTAGAGAPSGGLLLESIDLAAPGDVRRFALTLAATHWLRQHLISGVPVLPGMGLAALLHAAAGSLDSLARFQPGTLVNLVIETPVHLDDKDGDQFQVTLTPEHQNEDSWNVSLFSRRPDGWIRHGHAVWTAAPGTTEAIARAEYDVKVLPPVDTALYAAMRQAGIDYGPAFQVVREATGNTPRLALPACVCSEMNSLHPVLLDGALQTLQPNLPSRNDRCWVPVAIRSLRIHHALPPHVSIAEHAITPHDENHCEVSLALHARDGTCLVELEGVMLANVAASALTTAGASNTSMPTDESVILQELAAVTKKTGLGTAMGHRSELVRGCRQLLLTAIKHLCDLSGPPALAENFAALGLDSLGRMRLKSLLARTVKVDLPLSAFIRHPSPQALAEHLAQSIALTGLLTLDHSDGVGQANDERESFTL
ncbi:hypothetical protein D8B23_13805 [Verminephrobacter aporrectodeae subsp. tuberculatae]|uniref:beta-ketoacyl synthase N-terminal-like domain-containing protein n=1 Tax=Verminephrobacter aporrectodeae TaxID=1110389 RepID=UPI0022447E18|nr:beta-ketoacyl synthase N-terminal-like domain-containing protein [Verminephrobacter aporrectodeae]MCW8199466.1 hypothetical protein [Verminephrobacter aporrectodeae subsp. tuberculatae]